MIATPARTRLQRFLDAEGLTSAKLEKETNISRQAMTKIRAGQDVRRKTMLRILAGVRALTRRAVRMEEIFELDPEDGPPDDA